MRRWTRPVWNVDNTSKDSYSEKEAQERFEAALKGALKTPHKPRKVGGPSSKPKPSKKRKPRDEKG